MNTISVRNLAKYYHTYEKEEGFFNTIKSFFKRKKKIVKAVDGISFEIEKGEFVGFVGKNGAGKTTTLKCLSGLLYPDQGKISVLGFTPYERKREFLKKIAFITARKGQVAWDLPAIETYKLLQEIYEIPDDEFKKTLSELSSMLDFKDLMTQPVRTLSLGQRMKAELIASLLHKPKVLFLDEPTIGLDIFMQDMIRDFLYQYNKKYNSTILLTSHYMKDVESLCKRIILIDKGKIYYDGSLDKLKKEHIKTKLVEITFRQKPQLEKLQKLGIIKKRTQHTILMAVRKEKIPSVIYKITKDYRLVDLTIKEPDIGEIIKEIFNKEK